MAVGPVGEPRARSGARSLPPLGDIVAGFSVLCGVLASTAATREAGRAIGTAPDPATGQVVVQRDRYVDG